MVIFAPMVHVGWASAWEAVTYANCAVLGVHRHELPRTHLRHEQVSAAHQRLLVCVRHGLTGHNRLERRLDARESNDGKHDAIHLVQATQLSASLSAHEKLAALRQLLQHGVSGVCGICYAHVTSAMCTSRLHEGVGGRVCRKRDNAQFVGMLGADVEGLRPNRTRASEYGNAQTSFGHHRIPPKSNI